MNIEKIYIGLFLFSFQLISNITSSVSAQTYYYKQVKKVVNSQVAVGDNSGLFVTFSEKGCYDSDRNGFDVGNGFLSYKGKNDSGISIYAGSSFWGNAKYCFSQDKRRLNIRLTGSDIIYVYQIFATPSHVCTSDKIKQKQPIETPILPPPVVIDNGCPNIERKEKRQSRYGYRTCPSCLGTKRCSTCNGRKFISSSYTGDDMPCPNCTMGECSTCHGRGEVYGIK